MGKPTGFLEYGRLNNKAIEPRERIKNFNEFHPMLDLSKREEQAARCMNCGVPFCQSAVDFGGGAVSGCPLHNLIPEWNDEIYRGHYEHAIGRLLKTSNFPEFTSRVCPALCEVACTCGMEGSPVTIKENELAIIEEAFEKGYIKPRIPKIRSTAKVAVIGSGPAGLAVADVLNRRGHNVTVYERDDRIGGLLMYGIPNMKLEKEIINRRLKLMEAEGVNFVVNANVGSDVSSDEILKEYDAVVLACGAKEPRGLGLGEDKISNVYYAVDFLTSATKDLLCGEKFKINAKGKNVVIVGGGDTGNDCVGTCIRQGAKSVTQIEIMPCPPDTRLSTNPWPQWPKVLKTDYGQEEAIAVFSKDPRVYETTVKEIIKDKSGKVTAVKTVRVKFDKNQDTGKMTNKQIEGTEQILKADIVLIAAGFIGCQSYVAEAFGVKRTVRNVVETAPQKYATSVNKVFTAGDMHRGQSLVVWAIAEGRSCAKEVDEFLMGYSNLVEN